MYAVAEDPERKREEEKEHVQPYVTVRMMIPEGSIEKEGGRGGVEGGRRIPGFRFAKCSIITSGFDHCE